MLAPGGDLHGCTRIPKVALVCALNVLMLSDKVTGFLGIFFALLTISYGDGTNTATVPTGRGI